MDLACGSFCFDEPFLKSNIMPIFGVFTMACPDIGMRTRVRLHLNGRGGAILPVETNFTLYFVISFEGGNRGKAFDRGKSSLLLGTS